MSNHDPYCHHCAYTSGNRRCHYLGTFSHSTLGGGPLYCRAHDGLEDHAMGAMIVDRSHRDHLAPGWWTPERQREHADQVLQATREAWLREHGLERQDGESRQTYADTMRGFCLSRINDLGRMPK